MGLIIILTAGFFLLLFYGIYQKHTAREMFSCAFSGIQTVKNILLTFVLIGMITAVWRACGTIPYIVYHSTKVCNPHFMVLITFLLCCLISFLTGTAFGTAATMGVICVTMANSMGVPLLFTGGAVLAGSFFGDRCSPMSTSALLVSSLTKTDLFHNIVNMMKTSVVPFAVTCVIYAVVGMSFEVHQDTSGVQEIFADHFVLHWAALIPAVVMILFSLFKINVKITMGVSVLCGIVVAMLVQKMGLPELFQLVVFGYQPEHAEVRTLLSGGGILSMTRVFLIVCISSCYAGMCEATGLLTGVRKMLVLISRKITPYGGIFVTSVITAVIACNQTLSIMLTHQLCGELEKDPERMAIHLENTAVVIAALVPWSIAAAVPLSSVGAPLVCILTACYLYLLPLWNFAIALKTDRDSQKTISS